MKSTPVTYLLWVLGGFGVLGLHRFYLGRWVTGLIWLFTGGLCMIGAIIDLFVIPGMVRLENLAVVLEGIARDFGSDAKHLYEKGVLPKPGTASDA